MRTSVFIFLEVIIKASALLFSSKLSPQRVIENDILPLILESNRGLKSDNNLSIIESINKVIGEGKNNKSYNVDGKWKLLWTTEKETLFFAKSGLFGKKCTDISQTINTKENKIINQILFDGDREFTVNGSISTNDNISNRIEFQFQSANLIVPPLKLKLPPFGKGWFDNLYVDSKYRISYDIRGDYLISERV